MLHLINLNIFKSYKQNNYKLFNFGITEDIYYYIAFYLASKFNGN